MSDGLALAMAADRPETGSPARPAGGAGVGSLRERAWRVAAAYWSLPECCIGEPSRLDLLPLGAREIVKPQAFLLSLPPHRGRPAAYVKVFADGTLFERERTGLSLGNRAAGTAAATRVPTLLHVAATEQAVVVERIEGLPLSTVLHKRYFALPDWYFPAFHSLGRWLVACRRTPCEGIRRRETLDAHAQLTAESIGLARPVLGPAATARGRRLLAFLASGISDGHPPIVYCHGDFTADNVIASSTAFFVFDFAYSGPGYLDQDSTLFVESTRWLVGQFPFGQRVLRRIVAEFYKPLDGYTETVARQYTRDLITLKYLSHLIASRYYRVETSKRRRLLKKYTYIRTCAYTRKWLQRRVCTYGL